MTTYAQAVLRLSPTRQLRRRLGRGTVTETRLDSPRDIVNFPTKRHWRYKSLLSDIRLGLRNLRHELLRCDIRSIALSASARVWAVSTDGKCVQSSRGSLANSRRGNDLQPKIELGIGVRDVSYAIALEGTPVAGKGTLARQWIDQRSGTTYGQLQTRLCNLS